MSVLPSHVRQRVILRANNRCEYCGLSQLGQEATFHIDHIVPQSIGGGSELENLALACVSCSLRKGNRQNFLDPETDALVRLFNPRTDSWTDHFRWNGEFAIGVSEVGHATAKALQLNRALILEIRREEQLRGRHPPRS